MTEEKFKKTSPKKPKKVVKAAEAKVAVYMRVTSDEKAVVLRVIPANTSVFVSKVDHDWIQLTYNGITGWSKKEFFTLNYEE